MEEQYAFNWAQGQTRKLGFFKKSIMEEIRQYEFALFEHIAAVMNGGCTEKSALASYVSSYVDEHAFPDKLFFDRQGMRVSLMPFTYNTSIAFESIKMGPRSFKAGEGFSRLTKHNHTYVTYEIPFRGSIELLAYYQYYDEKRASVYGGLTENCLQLDFYFRGEVDEAVPRIKNERDKVLHMLESHAASMHAIWDKSKASLLEKAQKYVGFWTVKYDEMQKQAHLFL